MANGMGAVVSFIEDEEGWRVKVAFEDGSETLSDMIFETQAAAEAAFLKWCKDIGVNPAIAH